MSSFESIGKFLIFIGVILVILGVILTTFKHIPFLGKLPGDILIKRKNFTFYFPLMTSLILSILLSIILYFISKK